MIPPSEKNKDPRVRSVRKKTIVLILACAAILQLFGFGIIFARSRGIDILPSWGKRLQTMAPDALFGKEASAGHAEVNTAAKESPEEVPPVTKRRFHEQPIEDNVPVVDLVPGTEDGNPGPPLQQSAEAKMAVPAGPTPPEVSLMNGVVSLKCWDEKGFQQDGTLCHPVSALGDVLLERLYIADACRRETSENINTGVLSLGMEADFLRDALSFFVKEGSTVKYADQIVACLNQRLGSLSLVALKHRFARYHLAAKIKLGVKPSAAILPGQVVAKDVVEIETALKTAKEMAVTRDRVRVRKTPVDGEIIGFISAPRKVYLLEQNGDWCLVKTGSGNLGWMVCWGLGIGPAPAK